MNVNLAVIANLASARVALKNLPPTRTNSLAITKIEEAMLWLGCSAGDFQ